MHAKLYTAHRRLFGLQMQNAVPEIIRTLPEFIEIEKMICSIEYSLATTSNKKFFLQCRSLIHFFNGKLEESLQDQQEILKILNDGKMKRSYLKQRSYIQISVNVGSLMIEQNNLAGAEKIALDILALEPEFHNLPVSIRYQATALPRAQLIEIAIRKREYESAEPLAQELENFEEFDISQMPTNAPNIVLSTLIEYWLLVENFRKANRMLVLLKHIPESSKSRSLRIPLYETIIHMEQGNFELVLGIIKQSRGAILSSSPSIDLETYFEYLIELLRAKPNVLVLNELISKLENSEETLIKSTLDILEVVNRLNRWAKTINVGQK